MATTLIILAFAALAAGVVFFATRKRPERTYHQRLDQDTAWNDPVTPDAAPPADPFAEAPPPAARTDGPRPPA